MSPFAIQYRDLLRTLARLKRKYLSAFLPANPQHSPDLYELDVKAYCLLSHAAFEQYLEDTAIHTVSESIDGWTMRQRINKTVVSLIAFYGKKSELEDDQTPQTSMCFDRVRKLLDQLKREYSGDVRENHGVAVKHLRRILYPVAIDIPLDAQVLNSLTQLTNERGVYAHKYRAQHSLSPEDASSYVGDITGLCRTITLDAMRLVAATY